MNFYLVNSNGKYLNTDNGYHEWVDKKSATRYYDRYGAEYMADIYCSEFTIEPESYDK